MFNNILPAVITTTTIFVGSFIIWCFGIGGDPDYFFEWVLTAVLAALFTGVMWGLSVGDARDQMEE